MAVGALVVLLLGALAYSVLVHVDCGWSGVVRTWSDSDGDGEWDQTELPIEGIQLTVKYRDIVMNRVSSPTGETRFFIRRPCLELTRIEVYSEVPAGYRLTTKSAISTTSLNTGPFMFGFEPSTQ